MEVAPNETASFGPIKLILDLQTKIQESSTDFTALAYYPVDAIAEALGHSRDQVTFAVCLFLQFGLCLAFSLIKLPLLRKIFSVASGLFLLAYFYGTGALLLIASNMIAYLIYALLPRNTAAVMMTLWTFTTMIGVSIYYYLNQ